MGINTNAKTRYAVIAQSTGKVMKNAATRAEARQWKRETRKSGFRILDRSINALIS